MVTLTMLVSRQLHKHLRVGGGSGLGGCFGRKARQFLSHPVDEQAGPHWQQACVGVDHLHRGRRALEVLKHFDQFTLLQLGRHLVAEELSEAAPEHTGRDRWCVVVEGQLARDLDVKQPSVLLERAPGIAPIDAVNAIGLLQVLGVLGCPTRAR